MTHVAKRNVTRPGGVLRAICVLSLVLSILVTSLMAGAAWFVCRAVSRIHIEFDPQAVSQFMSYIVTESLRQGEPESRLQMINYLGEAGSDAKDFVPVLTGVYENEDEDPAIRAAVAEALKKINPQPQE